jgi:hypothetical protein
MGHDVPEARRRPQGPRLPRRGHRGQTEPVLVSSYHYLEGPAIAALALAIIVLICRWVFSTDRPTPPPAADPGDYGLLEPVTVVRTLDDAQMLRSLLLDAGIRGTVASTPEGFAVLVFSGDARRARELVRS